MGVLSRCRLAISSAFGTGRMLATQLLTFLFTSDGGFFVGAVNPQTLLKAANSTS